MRLHSSEARRRRRNHPILSDDRNCRKLIAAVRNFALKSVIFSSSIFCCYIKLITASLFQTVQQRISALFIDQMIPKFIPLGVCSITQTTGPCGGDERVAAFDADDGIGRFGSPAGGPNSVEANYPDLLTTAAKLAADWYGRTHIYPVHGTIVVKDSVLANIHGRQNRITTHFQKLKTSGWRDRLMGQLRMLRTSAMLCGKNSSGRIRYRIA